MSSTIMPPKSPPTYQAPLRAAAGPASSTRTDADKRSVRVFIAAPLRISRVKLPGAGRVSQCQIVYPIWGRSMRLQPVERDGGDVVPAVFLEQPVAVVR